MIRRATPHDADAIGSLFVRARDAMTYLPRIPDDDRPLLGGWIVDRHETWVDDDGVGVTGFVQLSDEFVENIYVDPEAQNRGIGTALLAHAKDLRPGGLKLWVFQENDGARRFYERHGFVLVHTTDGQTNMEREPDALYEWSPDAR